MRREDALENNLTWNCTVLDAHGVGYESTAHWWLSKERVPPYRSNFVTRTPDATEEQLARIGELVAHPPAHRWSVADSFACLDTDALQDFGFALLFEAQWYGSLGRSDNREETDVLFAQVQDEDALAGWESRWQEWSPAPGQRVFPPNALGRSRHGILDRISTRRRRGRCHHTFWRPHIGPLQRLPPQRIRNGRLLAGCGAPRDAGGG